MTKHPAIGVLSAAVGICKPRRRNPGTTAPCQYDGVKRKAMETAAFKLRQDHRLPLRLTATEEALIKAAAERQHLNMNEFILRSAREEAEQVLANQTRFVLDNQHCKLFMETLDREAQEKPRLRRLFSEHHVARRA